MHDDFIGTSYHMIIGEHGAGLVDDHTATCTFARLWIGKLKIAEAMEAFSVAIKKIFERRALERVFLGRLRCPRIALNDLGLHLAAYGYDRRHGHFGCLA